MFNTKVYIGAEKLMIPALKRLATYKYKERVAEHWNSSTFSAAAALLWESSVDTDTMLRSVVSSGVIKNIGTLLERGKFLELM